MVLDFASQFVNDNLIYLIVIGATGVGIYYLYQILRKIPTQPDFIKIFKERDIDDEELNIPEQQFGVKNLFRGHAFLGRISSMSEVLYESIPKTEAEQDKWKRDKQSEKIKVFTLTFKRPFIDLRFHTFYGFKKSVLRFTEDDRFNVEGDNLIFPSHTPFTALGYEYSTVNSYPVISRVIEDNWHKRLFEGNTNLMASRMALISGETPEYAHELQLKRLDIEKIKAEKQLRTSSLI